MRALFVLSVALAFTCPARAEWIVAHRLALPLDGAPIDLADLAAPDEDPVRIELEGSYTFLLDGSEIDALGVHGAERRDASAPLVVLPEGARVIESRPDVHRYTIEVPRTASMRVGLNVLPLAMRHLVTPTEARANLQGAIHLAHLVPPPPPPAAASVVVEEAGRVPAGAWLGGALGASMFALLGWVGLRRRGHPMRVLLRRARRAERAVAAECAVLGPAYDPVAASSARLLEAAVRTEVHWRAVDRALAKTAWASAAAGERARLHEQGEGVRRRLAQIVTRLEQTATMLAGRSADAEGVSDVDALLGELGDDLHAAVSAEEELDRFAS